MEKYLMLAIVIIAMLVAIVITRNDKDEHNSLTKKGFVKLMGLFTILFVLVVIIVVVSQ